MSLPSCAHRGAGRLLGFLHGAWVGNELLNPAFPRTTASSSGTKAALKERASTFDKRPLTDTAARRRTAKSVYLLGEVLVRLKLVRLISRSVREAATLRRQSGDRDGNTETAATS